MTTTIQRTGMPTIDISLQYSHTIGRAEFSGPGFRNPTAMARGEDDVMYVANRSYDYRPDGKRITMCTVGEEFISEFAKGVFEQGDGEAVSTDGALIWPTAITVGPHGNVYLADEYLNRISIYSPDGEYLTKWERPGDGDGQWDKPSGLVFGANDILYLVDSSNHRVQMLSADGEYLGQWGEQGSGPGQFNMPFGIETDQSGNVYVADWRNDRIQKFTADGKFVMEFGHTGDGPGQFNRPTDVAVDNDGAIYVADWNNDRMQAFHPDGSFAAMTYGEGSMSTWGKTKVDANPEMWEERKIAQGVEREKLFWGPIAVECDDEGRIFVVETARSRIQVFNKQDSVFYGVNERVSGGGGRL
jgi:DNA-binding beta-propeller fold protein YncE